MRNREKRIKRRSVSAKRRLAEHKSGFGNKISVKLPPGVNQFMPTEEGSYKIDIIPFEAGAGNPYAEKGEMYYERTYYDHAGVGPNKDRCLCPRESFKGKGKRCYVCEQRDKLGGDPREDKELKERKKALNPKERQLWNVYNHAEPEKGVQIWEISYHLFGTNLDDKITSRKELADSRGRFADPDKGRTLVLTAKKKDIGAGFKPLEFTVDEFLKRREPISDELLEQAVCLDDLIVETMEYKDVKNLFNAAPPDEDDEDDETEKAGKKRRQDKEDESDEEEDETDEEDDDEDDEDDEEGDDEDSEESDDDDDEDLDDEPPASKGDLIDFNYKGKDLKRGKVIKINVADSLLGVRHKKYPDKLLWIDYSDVIQDEPDEDELEDEEDDEPAPKKGRKKDSRGISF